MLMTKKSSWFWLSVGFVLFLSQSSCTKKIVPVSGRSGLTAQEQEASGGQSPPAPSNASATEESLAFPAEKALGLSSEGIQEEVIKQEKAPPEEEQVSAEEISAALGDVYFDYDKASLKPDSKVILQENARYLIQKPSVHIQIEGHTDERGSNAYNLALGARRARSVKRFLEALGVSPKRMAIISYGEENPFCKKSQKSCWRLNRRVHFQPRP